MNNLLSYQLFERKQVGVLYHFTNKWSKLRSILETGYLTSDEGFISFTRDFNLQYLGGHIRFNFDGTMLSDKYSIEPFAFHEDGTYFASEREERVLGDKVHFGKTLISIDILDVREDIIDNISSYEDFADDELIGSVLVTYKKRLEEENSLDQLQAQYPHIKFNRVTVFKPCK